MTELAARSCDGADRRYLLLTVDILPLAPQVLARYPRVQQYRAAVERGHENGGLQSLQSEAPLRSHKADQS